MLLFHEGLYILLLVRALNRKNVFYLYRIYEGNFGYAKLCHRVCPALSSYSGNQRWNCQGNKTPALALVRVGLQLWHIFIQAWPRLPCFLENQTNWASVPWAGIIVFMCGCAYRLCVQKKRNRGCGRQKKKKDGLACEYVYIWACVCVCVMLAVWESVWKTRIACVGWNEKAPLPLCRVNVRVRSVDGLSVFILLCVSVCVRVYVHSCCLYLKSAHKSDHFLSKWSQEAHNEQ